MSSAAIIFDCDGVLVNSEAIYIDVERSLLREIGLEFDIASYQARFVGLSHTDFLTDLAALCEARGLAFPADFDQRHAAASAARLEAELIAVPGLTRLLEAHRGPRAVASSSTPEALRWKLNKADLTAFFAPHIYSTAEVARGKPAPDVFLHAATHIGVAAANCIVIEDSTNGARAGKAAGMTVWGFTGAGHADDGLAGRLRDAGADQVFANYETLALAL